MEPCRVVEILQNSKSRGSGYLITPSHVLTAAHVVKPGSVGTKCVIHPLCHPPNGRTTPAQESRPKPVSAKLRWTSAKHDLALIEVGDGPLAFPDDVTVAFGEVPMDGMAHQVVGSGFPAAAGLDQRTIIGKLSWVLTGPRRFDIDVISAIPRDWTKWGGFSGAAIFADNLLVGVVRTVDENWNGSVLEATPASWLLDDSSFEKCFRDVGLVKPRVIDAGAIDRVMPLDFEFDISTASFLRFSPRNPRVPFLGRDAELRALNEFLLAERRHPFAWWLITGGGGAGKTRLALELCLHARRQRWRAGFLPRHFKAEVSALDAWFPRAPTLIIADYVMTRIEEIRSLAARLARRDGLPPLRLLLLEREAGQFFESKLLGSDQSDRGVIEKARYTPAPLSLPELTDDQLWNSVRERPWSAEGAPVQLTRVEFFRRLGQLDRLRRPLVAMILADALTSSTEHAGLGGLEQELRELLQRDRDHLWPKELGAVNAMVGKVEADIAIAFATMVDGLGPEELGAIEAARRKPIDPDILPACGIAIGKPLSSVPRLGRLEPDLIGEFFVLETLRRDPNNPFAKPAHNWMPKAAWRARAREMLDFVTRSMRTFPLHDAIQQIETTVEGCRESWLAASFRVLAEASDPMEGFDDVQRWLLPHAKSDPAAALTFADLTTVASYLEFGLDSAPRGAPSLRRDGPLAPMSMVHHSSERYARLLIALFGHLTTLHEAHADEKLLQEQIAGAMFNVGGTLGALGSSDDAIAAYDDLIACFSNATEAPIRERVASALFNRGVTLGALGRSHPAMATYDDLISRFGDASEAPIREAVARALFNEGATLYVLGRWDDAIVAYEDLIARFGDASEVPVRERIASALFNRGVALGALGRSDDAIAAYDDLIARFGDASEMPISEQVAGALFNKGAALDALGRREDAIAAYDDLMARFGDLSEAPIRERVANALFSRGATFRALDRSHDEVAAYDDLIARFGDASEAPIRERVAKVLLNRGDFALRARPLRRRDRGL